MIPFPQFMPSSASPPSFVTSFDGSSGFDADTVGWTGFNVRQLISDSLLSNKTGKTFLRVTVRAASAEALAISSMYVGHGKASSDFFDFASAPTQVTFASSASTTISAGSTETSDAIAFAYDGTSDILFSFYISGASSDGMRRDTSITNCWYYYKSGSNESSTADVTGYTEVASSLVVINTIELGS